MNGLEWVFSFVLALVFLITGGFKLLRYEQARRLMPWVNDLSRALVLTIGIAEILGGLGLVLPAVTGIYPWLTPVAAIALALLQLLAAMFHLFRGERSEVFTNIILLILLSLVAYLRWPLMF